VILICCYGAKKRYTYQEDGLLKREFLYSSFDDACAERYDSGLDEGGIQQRLMNENGKISNHFDGATERHLFIFISLLVLSFNN
jgi:hypothetical protein